MFGLSRSKLRPIATIRQPQRPAAGRIFAADLPKPCAEQ
jgi:hypothetical protein